MRRWEAVGTEPFASAQYKGHLPYDPYLVIIGNVSCWILACKDLIKAFNFGYLYIATAIGAVAAVGRGCRL